MKLIPNQIKKNLALATALVGSSALPSSIKAESEPSPPKLSKGKEISLAEAFWNMTPEQNARLDAILDARLQKAREELYDKVIRADGTTYGEIVEQLPEKREAEDEIRNRLNLIIENRLELDQEAVDIFQKLMNHPKRDAYADVILKQTSDRIKTSRTPKLALEAIKAFPLLQPHASFNEMKRLLDSIEEKFPGLLEEAAGANRATGKELAAAK